MDKSTPQSSPNRARIRNDLLHVYFCRKLLSEGLLTADDLYPPENNAEPRERQVETPVSAVANSPSVVNGTETPNQEPTNIQRLFNQQPDQLTIQLENTMAPKAWNCGVYSPIEVFIDSPSAVDNSGQASTMLSSMASEDLSGEGDLFEMDVLERINRLRRQGKWSLTRLPLCLDAPRPKTHYDYFLEECAMMQVDFVRERVTKKMIAKILAYEAKHYVHQKKSGVINLCKTSGPSAKRARKRASDSISELISNLPADYVGDLKSRVASTDLFKDLNFGASNDDRWKLAEEVCSKIASVRPTNLLEPANSNLTLRNFAGTLLPYQNVALKWFLTSFDNSFGCILADEKKLGKKVSVLAFLAYLEEHRRVVGPHLIVTDEAANWSIALERFLPYADVFTFTDQKDDVLHGFNICLVDYETFFSDAFSDSFGNCAFQVLIIDKLDQLDFLEEKSLEYLLEENQLHGDYRFRVFLDDSAFLERKFEQKRLPTMLLQLLLPKQFQNAFENGLNDEELKSLSAKRLVSFLQTFQLSRTKSQVCGQIPSSSLEVCKCRMTAKQQRLYNKLIELPEMKQVLTSDKPIQALDALRKCCFHPFLVQEDRTQVKSPLNLSLWYPILRQCFLDRDQTESCEQLQFKESFRARLQRLQTSSLNIVQATSQSLVCCSPPTNEKLNVCLHPAIATNSFQFVGKNESSLSSTWHRNRFKQLATELFKQRSCAEDEAISNACLRLLDKNMILSYSGKLQELFKRLTRLRRKQKRCIIFTYYPSTQQLLCEALSHHNFTYMLLNDDVDRKEFLDTFNKNQRIACVLASTRDSLYRLNLNNIGAIFVLEADWDLEFNDNIKRYFTKTYQNAGAEFYNLVTEKSIEVRTNVFDSNVKPLLTEISRSVASSVPTSQIELDEPQRDDADLDKDLPSETTTLYAPICHEIDGVESTSDTMSTSGYEGSLDENASIHAEPLVYDRTFLESDSYLSSVFGLQWRQHANNDKVGFVEEAQVFDSFSNVWYTGDIIEPEEIEYTKMTPSEQLLDEDTLFDFGEDRENQYIDSGAMSPKSTDEFLDLSTPPTSVDASRISTEFSLDPAIQLSRGGDQDQDSRMLKRSQRMQSRTDELRRKLLETQAIVLPDPDPLFRPDGKPGYTPSKKGTEWHDADTPLWTYIEDRALLALTVKQMCGVPIPNYVSRAFCLNWELIAFELDKYSFHKRSPNQCCTRFRELIAKKFAPVEDPAGLVEQFEGIDLSALKDERVLSSSQQTTKFFNRSVSALARKLEDLKRIRNTWQARSNWLNSCDDGERFDVLNRSRISTSSAFDSSRLRRILDCPSILPSDVLTPNKKGLPLDMVMISHQYSRGLRLSRVITAAKSFMIKAMKKPVEYQQIAAYSQSVTYSDQKMFVRANGIWELQTFSSPAAFNYHSVKAPKIQVPLENRLLWVDHEALEQLDSEVESKIFNLLQFNFMQLTVDIRSNMLSSRKQISEILQVTSDFVLPKMPKRPKRVVKMQAHPSGDVDGKLLEDIQQTLSSIGTSTNAYRVLKNGISVLPIRLENFAQNNTHFYTPVLAPIPSSFTLKLNRSSFDVLSKLFAHKKPQKNIKKNAASAASLLEDLLIECQDREMFRQTSKIQIEESATNRLFSASDQSNLVIKIQKRPINTSSTTKSRHLITCVPGDHFELHKVDFDTKTQKFCAQDLHTQSLLDSSTVANENARSQMQQFISKMEASAAQQFESVLTVNKQQTSIDEPEKFLFNSTVCNLNSSRLQRERIQHYSNENKPISIFNLIPEQNNCPEQKSNFDYVVRLTKAHAGQIPFAKQHKRRIQIGDLPKSKKLPTVSRVGAQSKDSMRLLVSQKGPSEAAIKNAANFNVQVDKAVSNSSNAVISVKNPTAKSKSPKFDTTTLEAMLKLFYHDEESITVNNLTAINQLYKLTRPTIGYRKSVKASAKLPQTSVTEMAKITKFIRDQFGPKLSTFKSLPVHLNNSTQNPLEKLINEQYSTIFAELQQLQGDKGAVKSNRNGCVPSPIALKLQLSIRTPQFTQILPTSPSKFSSKYLPTDRILRLKYQTPIQQERLAISRSDGSNVALNVEFQQLESIPVTPSKLIAPQPVLCPILEEPLLKNELINALMKMSNLERRRWFDALKHRFLRHKNLQQKQRVLRSVDKMQRIVDEVLLENGEDLTSQNHETDVEYKKATIRRLLASTDTKYPIELASRPTIEFSSESPDTDDSLQLAELLLQCTAKSRTSLSDKVHPTFEKVDLTVETQWKNRKEALKIDYKNVDKQVIAFDHSLENFFEKLDHKLSSKALEAELIESSGDIYAQLLCRPNAAPSKIIKYRAPIEIQPVIYSEPINELPIDYNIQTTSIPADLNMDQYVSGGTHYIDDQIMSGQQIDPSRERQMSSIQIPSAMQVPASVYHLQTNTQTTMSIQPIQQTEPIYYTKRNSNAYAPVSGNSSNVQRSAPVQAQTLDTRYATTSTSSVPKREAQQFPKTSASRPMVRHVVVGNRSKMPGEMDERQYIPQREDPVSFEPRYYQPAPGQRELTVREKLQQDMARGVVPTSQKKLYPVRVPTTMKRKATENQHFGSESPTGSDPKRSRPTQYMYQVKGPPPSTSSMPSNAQQVRSVQATTNMSISNIGEQQSTNQTVPIIFQHGEPIKTYIRRENHQFSIHDPANYPQSSSANPPQYPKTSAQLKVYEKRPMSNESDVMQKRPDESDAPSNSV